MSFQEGDFPRDPDEISDEKIIGVLNTRIGKLERVKINSFGPDADLTKKNIENEISLLRRIVGHIQSPNEE